VSTWVAMKTFVANMPPALVGFGQAWFALNAELCELRRDR
jgi:hypothetical protein